MTWALRTDLPLDEVNNHLGALLDAGLLGIAEEGGSSTVYLPQRRDDLPVTGTWSEVAEQDWNEAWKAGIAPVSVGDVTIVPPWLDPPPTAEVVLVIEPAQAFGTGHHETTVSCLAALQRDPLDGASVFDVGTGTGVLALAAKALGAGRVLACDIDPVAVEAAALNAERNRLAVDVRQGSAEAAADERFDVVIANLDTATLSRLATDIARAVSPGGRLIASGVSNERVGEALDALRAAGFAVSAEQGHQWALIDAERSRPRT